MTNLPHLALPRVTLTWDQGADPFAWDWAQGVTLPPLMLANGSGPAQQQTITQACYNDNALFVHFDCADQDIWGTYTQRGDAIYDEEVVELFIGVGSATPVDYYEFEVSPNGVLLDVKVHNPDSDRATIQLDFGWECPGLRWGAQRDDAHNRWRAYLAIPWSSIGGSSIGGTASLPTAWRANFYRIERPRSSAPEFSCWSPTMTDPADFHKPLYFGMLTLV
jgi:Carbohydrate-binding family 9